MPSTRRVIPTLAGDRPRAGRSRAAGCWRAGAAAAARHDVLLIGSGGDDTLRAWNNAGKVTYIGSQGGDAFLLSSTDAMENYDLCGVEASATFDLSQYIRDGGRTVGAGVVADIIE